jgi:predicted dehydrogenase
VVQASPSWSLAGIVENNPAVRAPFEKAGVPILTREAVLKDDSIEVIAVESEVKPHAADGLAALNAGKHVHLEKPPSLNRNDMRALLDAARLKQRLLQMGYMWRHHVGVQKLIEAARSQWLGDVYLVRGTMNTLIDAERRPEWNLFSGGQMFEQGGHLLDPIVRMLGMPAKITPFLRSDGSYQDGLKDNTAVVLEYPRAMAIVTSAVLQPNANSYRTLEVFGSNGTAVLRPIEPPTLEIDLVKPAGPYQSGRQKIALPPFKRYEGDFRELAECILQNKPLSVTPDEDWNVQQVLLTSSRM